MTSATRALEDFALEFRKQVATLSGSDDQTRKEVIERLDSVAMQALLRLWRVRDFESRTSRLIDDERLQEARALLAEAKSSCGDEPEFFRLESLLWFLERPLSGGEGRTPDVSSGGAEAP